MPFVNIHWVRCIYSVISCVELLSFLIRLISGRASTKQSSGKFKATHRAHAALAHLFSTGSSVADNIISLRPWPHLRFSSNEKKIFISRKKKAKCNLFQSGLMTHMLSSTCFASFRRFPPVRNFCWIQLAASNASSQLIETTSQSNRRRWHLRGIWAHKIFRRSLCDLHHCRLRSKGRNKLWIIRRRNSSCCNSTGELTHPHTSR